VTLKSCNAIASDVCVVFHGARCSIHMPGCCLLCYSDVCHLQLPRGERVSKVTVTGHTAIRGRREEEWIGWDRDQGEKCQGACDDLSLCCTCHFALTHNALVAVAICSYRWYVYVAYTQCFSWRTCKDVNFNVQDINKCRL